MAKKDPREHGDHVQTREKFLSVSLKASSLRRERESNPADSFNRTERCVPPSPPPSYASMGLRRRGLGDSGSGIAEYMVRCLGCGSRGVVPEA